jgi:hypothetical protein
VHGRRPRTHRTQQPVTTAHDPAGHAPARKRHVVRLPELISHQTSIASNGRTV